MTSSRKLIAGFIATLILLPVMAFASTEYKGTETVNINKADAATLAAYLKGIGASKAEAIVAYRKSNGNFKSLTDLKEVPGIGEGTYKNLKTKISTSKGKIAAPEGYKLAKTNTKPTKSSNSKTVSKKTTDSSSKDKSSKSKDSKSSKSTASKATKSKTSSKAKSTAKKTLEAKKK